MKYTSEINRPWIWRGRVFFLISIFLKVLGLFTGSAFVRKLFTDLFEKQSDKERGKEGEGGTSFIPCSFLIYPQEPWLGLANARSQEFNAGLLCG